jgi:hypothetical protein
MFDIKITPENHLLIKMILAGAFLFVSIGRSIPAIFTVRRLPDRKILILPLDPIAKKEWADRDGSPMQYWSNFIVIVVGFSFVSVFFFALSIYIFLR